MPSPAERLASNIDLSVLGRATELKKRLWFVVGALIVYRIGTYIPIPGIDPQALHEIMKQHASGVLGIFNMFSGGALEQLSIFALGIMPYISASIILQLLTVVIPALEQMQKEGEQGRRKINQYTRYGAVVLSLVQGYFIAQWLESSNRNYSQFGSVVLNPGIGFRAMTMLTLTTGTAFIMWLGEQITERGIGNGISLIIFAGIVARLPDALVQTYTLFSGGGSGESRELEAIGIAVMLLVITAFGGSTSASRNSAAVWKRSSGSLAIALRMNSERCAGIVASRSMGGFGTWQRCAVINA